MIEVVFSKLIFRYFKSPKIARNSGIVSFLNFKVFMYLEVLTGRALSQHLLLKFRFLKKIQEPKNRHYRPKLADN